MRLTIVLSLLSVLFAGSTLTAQQTVNFSVIVYTSEMEPGEKIYLASDHPRFTFYGPNGFPLIKTSPNTYMAAMKAKTGEQIAFTIVRDNPSISAKDQSGEELGTQVVNVQRNVLLEYRLGGWTDRAGYSAPRAASIPSASEPVPAKPKVFRRNRMHTDIKADGLHNRDVKIILPDEYRDGNNRYPVIYVHDGYGVLSGQGSQSKKWRIDKLLDQMTERGEMEPSILVVVNNTGSRTLKGSSQRIAQTYAAFVSRQLKRFIDDKYRTLRQPEYNTYIGSGEGGLVAMMLNWEHSDQFGKAICYSPKFEFPEQYYSYLDRVVNAKNVPYGQKIFIDVGQEGIDAGSYPGAARMYEALRDQGLDTSWYNGTLKADDYDWEDRLKRALRYIGG